MVLNLRTEKEPWFYRIRVLSGDEYKAPAVTNATTKSCAEIPLTTGCYCHRNTSFARQIYLIKIKQWYGCYAQKGCVPWLSGNTDKKDRAWCKSIKVDDGIQILSSGSSDALRNPLPRQSMYLFQPHFKGKLHSKIIISDLSGFFFCRVRC